ncbi:sigma-70 family RNA polymerase sigma factor [Patescibacteria group bacterium]|nr:MAG: sigma-70 family RNA polymerase sigma factor [Patescibacteria group bacterium]
MAGAGPQAAPTGEALFLSQLDVIERVISFVSARRHLPGVEADDFESHVKLKLIEDDYAVLRKFQGRSSLRTYLTVVIQRMFLDYRISAWGKWRPSAEAKRAGEVAVLLEQLMVRDRCGFDEACELLETNHQVTVPRKELEAIAGRLPSRVRRRFESEEALAHVASAQPPIDDVIAERERAATAERVTAVLTSAMAGLDAQDRLVLALRFDDGRTIVEIAGMLRLDQKGLYRRLERLLKGLRSALQAEGIDSPAVMEMLESPAVSIDWRGDTKETSKVRPSMGKGDQEWR